MFQWLIRFSVTHKVVVGVFTLALIVWGILSLLHLPFDSTPDITSNQVQVISTAPALGAQEVEQTVTAPVEAALANIPRVRERRSISRSGLSVVTLVFDEDADIYWARGQVSQALQELPDEFPSGKADVSLAPVSTGLGEIYHYTVRPAPGYEDRYSLSDIREVQDWIVRRGLAGTPGVAEVSGWGGFVREYEVRVDPDRLAAAGVTLSDVAEALEKNNSNTGGGYIEKNSNQYFIRGLGVAGTPEDLGNVAVERPGTSPVLVKDIAEVGFGHATRYGAVTRNGEGEVVAGIALMLKGENFQEVSRNVKDRIEELRKAVPEGIVIEPFIDRTDLVDRVTSTIERNLIEGGLIVVFILVIFLGSWKAGLVVASVIPLSMLFAFGMMRAFGVSGNLMSLGAIDFGLIVDGAVIIVECVCVALKRGKGRAEGGRTGSAGRDEVVIEAATGIRKSAAFGEIIIMIVYLPLLTLSGIEGKMFRPMALTLFFAILGAFILSLTYVPMASALFLRAPKPGRWNVSDRMMGWLHRAYRPVLRFCLDRAVALIAAMALLFGGAVWVFTRLGGEFVPTLEEGDFAVEISMAQGTSLSQMVEATTMAERIIRERFPEVRQAVTRIGSAEIPTDPMPVERADMLISLKPKKEWTSARTTAELMEKMEEALDLIPGMEAEMSQPVQMRNNELITGIRQDVAVMIYGPDLDVLARKAREVAELIDGVPGVGTPKVEEVKGLPQIQVEYDRARLAAYGVTVAEANEALEGAFAGLRAGTVYEGDRSFGVVVRLDPDSRGDIADVRRLPVAIPGGGFVPLEALATVEFRDAPAQITHDDGQRRIYVGFNVRGRDVQSTVNDIQRKIDAGLKLPAGYTLRYGGEFRNFQEATERLGVAVPLALLLILVLLYATLRSVKETLIVFSAIPMALIGGVAALWMRGMPFSISAGVGFIALFGVAVLNGIVLMGQFNTFEREGVTDVRRRIMMGCELRLRPVIMTALVASMGFLPMAVSHGDGAEVQRPLATVVIGGLVSAMILTLLVLPAMYYKGTRSGGRGNLKGRGTRDEGRGTRDGGQGNRAPRPSSLVPLTFLLLVPLTAEARVVTLEECVDSALARNPAVNAAALEAGQARMMRGTAFDPPMTEVTLKQETTGGGGPENGVYFGQEFDFPTLYVARHKTLAARGRLADARFAVMEAEVEASVAAAYCEAVRLRDLLAVCDSLDAAYGEFCRVAEARVEQGEAGALELMNARRVRDENRQAAARLRAEYGAALESLRLVAGMEGEIRPQDGVPPIGVRSGSFEFGATSRGSEAAGELEVARREAAEARQEFLPGIRLGATVQALIKSFNPYHVERLPFEKGNFMGFEVGITVPLFFGAKSARARAAETGRRVAALNLEAAALEARSEEARLRATLGALDETLRHYRTAALPRAEEMIRLARVSYRLGDIDYLEYIANIETAYATRRDYAQCVYEWCMAAININRLWR